MAINLLDTATMPLNFPYVPVITYTLPPPPPPLSPFYYYYYYYPTSINPLNFSFPFLNTPSCCVDNPCYPFSCPLLHHPPATTISTGGTHTPPTITETRDIVKNSSDDPNGCFQMNTPLYYSFNPTIFSYPSLDPSLSGIFNSSYPLCYPLLYHTTTTLCSTDNPPITETMEIVEYPKKKKNSKVFLKEVSYVHISPRVKRFRALKNKLSFRRHFYRRVKPTVYMWKPKSPSSSSSSSTTTALCFDFEESEALKGGKTSLMIKNIPNSLRKKVLLKYLDDHCYKENQVVLKDQPTSEYDFLYLPMDFRSGLNFGYAFVNFTNGTAAVKFYKSFHNKKWDDFDSHKICEIKYARLQGKEQLVNSFKRSYFECWTDEFLPTLFAPPRNGGADSIATKPSYIGRRKQKGF